MAVRSDDDKHEITLTGLSGRHPVGVGARSRSGMDTVYTKAAIDLQTVVEDGAEAIAECLESVRDVSGVDAVFIAMLDEGRQRIENVYSARSVFSTCNPEVLAGMEIAPYAWLQSHMTHLRVLELTDTNNSAEAEAGLFAELNVGERSVLCFLDPSDQVTSGWMGPIFVAIALSANC